MNIETVNVSTELLNSSFCDKVFNGEILIVSRPKNENIVMMSEAEYNGMKTASCAACSNPAP